MTPAQNNIHIDKQQDDFLIQQSVESTFRTTAYPSPFFRLIRYCMLMILVMNCSCTEMQIISAPTQENFKALNLMKSLRRFRVRYINLQNDTYACFTAIKQKPFDAKSEPTQKSKMLNSLINGNVPSNCKLDKSIFQHQLSLLEDDIGVRHYTKQFIYGYKHKRIISQYDDQFTKHNNQKKQLQNFTMGVFQLEIVNQLNKQQEKVDLQTKTYENYLNIKKQQEKQQNLNLNLLDNSPKPINLKYAHEAIRYAQIDHHNKIISLTNPLQVYPHQIFKTYDITLYCERQSNSFDNLTSQPYFNHSIMGMSISNFQIITFTQIPRNCRSVFTIQKTSKWSMTFNPGVNVLGKLLVGDLDTACNVKHDSGLNEGDYILLRTERKVEYTVMKQNRKKKRIMNVGSEPKQVLSIQINGDTGQAVVMRSTDEEPEPQPIQPRIKPIQQFFVVEITSIRGQNIYQINTELPWTLKIKKCEKIKFAPNRRIDYSGQVKAGNKIPAVQYVINNPQSDRLIEIETVGPKLIKKQVQQNRQYLQPGMDLFCMMELKFAIAPETPQIQFIGLTVGKDFGENHVEIHSWAGQSLFRMFQQFVFMNSKMSCVPYLSWIGDKMRQSQINPINHVIKLSKHKKNRIKFEELNILNAETTPENINNNQQKINRNSILMISMTKDAVFEIQTTVTQKNPQQISIEQSVDPIDPSQQQTQNTENTEEQPSENVVSHNKYYANSNKIYKVETIYKNKTKIRLQRLENQFYQNSTNENMIIIHNSIWRAGDFVKFPRFLFAENEKITAIFVKFGSIFVRILDLALINPQFFTVSSSEYLNHAGYGPRNRPQTSLATEYLFKWGTFCGGNINKNRQTLLKIRCGESWYKLQSVTEISPCTYEIQITSQYLCDKNVIFPALKQGFNTFNGSMCLPAIYYKSSTDL